MEWVGNALMLVVYAVPVVGLIWVLGQLCGCESCERR